VWSSTAGLAAASSCAASGTASAWGYDVRVTNTLFLDTASHNIITDNPVNGWVLDHDTIFATQGGFELPSNGTNTITNVIKYGGYVYTPGGSWITDGDVWFGGGLQRISPRPARDAAERRCIRGPIFWSGSTPSTADRPGL